MARIPLDLLVQPDKTPSNGLLSRFSKLRERMERELSEQVSNVRVKVIASPQLVERKFSVWIGGSILASLGSFHQMWMSKSDYEEHGASLIHRKAP
jgi:actin-like protein 6A